MNVALQLVGILFIIASLVSSIIAIINKTSATYAVVFLIIGGAFIRLGRILH